MKKIGKVLLALMLTLTMFLTIVPVFAEGEGENTLKI